MTFVGKHLILELHGIESETIRDTDGISLFIEYLIDASGYTKLYTIFEGFGSHSITGIITISRGHLCIYTCPDHNYVGIDFFTCDDPTEVYEISRKLTNYFNPQVYYEYYLDRGKKAGLGELQWD